MVICSINEITVSIFIHLEENTMLNNKPLTIVLLVGMILVPGVLLSEDSGITESRHSIEFSPMSPLFNIYALQYNYRMTSSDELILGVAYTNIQYDFGETNAATAIIGYRRFFWKNLHIDYQLWLDYDRFYEKNEDRYYRGVDVWNEFRLGYRFDFTLVRLPAFINLQWPFGFGLYAQNKPESFKEHEKDNRFFYFPPMFFFGIRF